MGEVADMMPPNTHPQAYLTEIAQKYGFNDGLFYLDLWPVADSQVVITNPDLANQVTVTKPLAVHHMAADFLRPMLGDNVIAAVNGPTWKRLHHAMSPAFSWNHVRNFSELIVDEVLVFRKTLDRHCESSEAFSMEETAVKLIFDVITRIVFNFPLNAQTEGSQTLDDLRELIHLAETQFSFNPLVKVRTWYRKRFILNRLHGHIESKIKERFNLLRSENMVPSRKDPYSVLDLMLREQLLETSSTTSEIVPQNLSRDNLDLLVTKYVADLNPTQGLC
jgi:cytochrome P450